VDPTDEVTFTADRHKVAARWVRQDAAETVFIDDLGVIAARWPTSCISRIEWPTDEQSEDEEETRGQRWADKLETIRQQHPHAWMKWTDDEDEQLAEEFDNGTTVDDMASIHGRGKGGVVSRLVTLGLVERGTSEADWTRWTAEDVSQLAADFHEGTTIEEMASAHGLRMEAIEARLVRLGLIQPPGRESRGAKWSDDEDNQLTNEFNAGLRVSNIAALHGRTSGGIISRLVKLGLVPKGTSVRSLERS
jgi:hypothetical protein